MPATWREVLLDEIEGGVRARFGRGVKMVRDVDGEGALRLCVQWPEGGGSYIRLAPNTPHTALDAEQAIEVITESLWRFAPIVGSC